MALRSSFGPTQTFANDIIPGVEQTNSTVAATLPWIAQTEASLGPQELGGVAAGLVKAVPPLAQVEAEQVPFYEQTDKFNKCLTNVIIPAGNTKLQDGAATSGVEDYKEFWYSLVGLSGIGQSFDGNGTSDEVPGRKQRRHARLAGNRDARAAETERQQAAHALAADAARHQPGLPGRRAAV